MKGLPDNDYPMIRTSNHKEAQTHPPLLLLLMQLLLDRCPPPAEASPPASPVAEPPRARAPAWPRLLPVRKGGVCVFRRPRDKELRGVTSQYEAATTFRTDSTDRAFPPSVFATKRCSRWKVA